MNFIESVPNWASVLYYGSVIVPLLCLSLYFLMLISEHKDGNKAKFKEVAYSTLFLLAGFIPIINTILSIFFICIIYEIFSDERKEVKIAIKRDVSKANNIANNRVKCSSCSAIMYKHESFIENTFNFSNSCKYCKGSGTLVEHNEDLHLELPYSKPITSKELIKLAKANRKSRMKEAYKIEKAEKEKTRIQKQKETLIKNKEQEEFLKEQKEIIDKFK